MGSSRFPGKPLAPILGLPTIIHILRRCQSDGCIDRVVVATCDEEIRTVVDADGGEVIMTANTHPGCVDRTEEAVGKLASGLDDNDLVVMVQGDEILVEPALTSAIIADYERSAAPVVNLASRLYRETDHYDVNCVKVVADVDGNALYFSRSPIPSRARECPSWRTPTPGTARRPTPKSWSAP